MYAFDVVKEMSSWRVKSDDYKCERTGAKLLVPNKSTQILLSRPFRMRINYILACFADTTN